MSVTGIAALIAAVSLAVLTLTGVILAIRLSGMLGAMTTLIREAGEGHETVLARVNAAVDQLFGALAHVPLGMAQEARAIVDKADQKRLDPGTAASQHLA